MPGSQNGAGERVEEMRRAGLAAAGDLEAAVWLVGMAHQYPARYRETARTLLDRVLGNGASDPGDPLSGKCVARTPS